MTLEKPRILAVDDEDRAQVLLKEKLGSVADVVVLGSSSEAVKYLRDPGFSLYVFDLFMPDFRPFGIDNEQGTKTGLRLAEILKKTPGLEEVPIILISQHYREKVFREIVQTWASKQTNVFLVNKQFADIEATVNDVLTRGGDVSTATDIDPAEHPDIAPYHVFDRETGSPLRVCFENYKPGSTNFAAWDLSPRLLNLLPIPRSKVYELRLRDTPEGDPLGLYYGGSDEDPETPWWSRVALVTNPACRHDEEKRPVSGVGNVLLARFIRSILYERSRHNAELFGSLLEIDTPKELAPFFRHAGISRRTRGLYLDEKSVRDFLRRVSVPAALEGVSSSSEAMPEDVAKALVDCNDRLVVNRQYVNMLCGVDQVGAIADRSRFFRQICLRITHDELQEISKEICSAADSFSLLSYEVKLPAQETKEAVPVACSREAALAAIDGQTFRLVTFIGRNLAADDRVSIRNLDDDFTFSSGPCYAVSFMVYSDQGILSFDEHLVVSILSKNEIISNRINMLIES